MFECAQIVVDPVASDQCRQRAMSERLAMCRTSRNCAMTVMADVMRNALSWGH